jgi:carboxypeptidase Taq
MNNAYQKLESIFTQQNHLDHLHGIASWDEAVMMPPAGGEARANALSTLQGIKHQQLTTPMVHELIAAAQEDKSLSEWQKVNLKKIQKIIINANLLPNKLVQDLTKSTLICEQQWRIHRKANDWNAFMPYLKHSFNLVFQAAQCRAEHWKLSPYDVLLDDYNPDFNEKKITALFTPLEEQLPTLIQCVIEKQSKSAPVLLNGPFNHDDQISLGHDVMKLLGFDFDHGRLDTAHHPFCGGSPEDVRITTRCHDSDFLSSLMAVCHETGHGIYEQNLPLNWRTQPVGKAMGMAWHESQSLFVEMQICRSKAFINLIYPLLQKYWNKDSITSPTNLFSLATHVRPSLIRVDADEVTYPLHVILRYTLERNLFNRSITIEDLPEAWNEMMQNYFNLNTDGNFSDGVMQDVHWPSGAFGYFPAYTLGRLIAAQLFATMEKHIPDIDHHIEQGDLNILFSWLNKNLHSQGQLIDTSTLLEKITGETLNSKHFITHIENRYL